MSERKHTEQDTREGIHVNHRIERTTHEVIETSHRHPHAAPPAPAAVPEPFTDPLLEGGGTLF